MDCFNCLPIVALINDKIICMHGGLSPELTFLNDINKIQRPIQIPEEGIVCDLLWSDPSEEEEGWAENDRGVSYTFGVKVINVFNQRHNVELICRAHQVVEDG